MHKNLMLVDASHFVFRAYHALPPLTTTHGTPIGAVMGFFSMILKLLDQHRIQMIAIIGDSKEPTFRHQLYEAYKANRPPPPSDLVTQFALIDEGCQAFGLPVIRQSGVEADDLIASYAHAHVAQGGTATLLSSDKDLMQLLQGSITMFDPMKEKIIDAKIVQEKFGVNPDQMIDMQALIGDSSDNIPGVPGIGPKTASTLLQQFPSLDSLYENLDHVARPRVRTLLQEHKDKAFLSHQLATLKTDLVLPTPTTQLTWQGITYDRALLFLEKYQLNTLKRRLEQKRTDKTDKKIAPHLSWQYADSNDSAAMQQLLKLGHYAVAVDSLELCAFFHPSVGAVLMSAAASSCVSKYWDSKDTLKIVHNSHKIGKQLQTPLKGFEDVQLAVYLLYGPNELSLDELFEKMVGTVRPVAQEATDPEKNALENAWLLWHLWPPLRKELIEKKLWHLYQQADKPLVRVLLHMEKDGVHVSAGHLKKLGAVWEKTIETLTEKVYAHAGTAFNIASPKQLGEILFSRMQLTPPKKKGKTGAYSTSSDVLEKLDHPIKEDLLAYRRLAKLQNTYIAGLLEAINAQTGRIHTTYLSTATSTGRLASVHPNLQNIPVRDEEGRQIRGAFMPQDGQHFLTLDYSQIELRLLAHMGSVAPLIQAFKDGQDLHKKTASEMFEVPLDDVTPAQRRSAKMINFGIIYGMSGYGLAERLTISRDQAKKYIESYLRRYSGIQRYMDTCVAHARAHGYVTTLWGRRCFVRDIHNKNPMVRGMAERLAINAPLQGTSADLMRAAMVRIDKLLQKEGGSLRLLLQIHDELLFEGTREDIARYKDRLVHCMQDVAHLSVPLTIHGHTVTSWAA